MTKKIGRRGDDSHGNSDATSLTKKAKNAGLKRTWLSLKEEGHHG
jgi:hypothetical protein